MADDNKESAITTKGLYVKAHGDKSVGIFPEAFTVAPENGGIWFESEEHLLKFKEALYVAFEVLTGEACAIVRSEVLDDSERQLEADYDFSAEPEPEDLPFSFSQILLELNHWQKICNVKVEGFKGGKTRAAAYQGKKHLSTKWGDSAHKALSSLLSELMAQDPTHTNKCRLSGCDNDLGKGFKRDKDKPELPTVAVCHDCQYNKAMEAAMIMINYSEDGLPF